MRRFRIAPVLLAVFASACATSGSGAADPSGAPGTVAAAGEPDPSRLTAAEIQAADLPNAYELVSRLRRPWLRRDPVTGAAVSVYEDNRPLGGAEALREIPAVEVAELRFVPYEDASMRWGAAVEGSVIIVVRRR